MLNFDGIIEEINNKTAGALNKAGAIVLRSAKTNCPVDTGHLRRSISMTTADAENLEVGVFSNVEYAPYVEAGTEKRTAQPFMQPALEANRTAILECFENIL